MSNELRNFLALSYDELEDLNLKAKEERKKRVSLESIREEPLQCASIEAARTCSARASVIN